MARSYKRDARGRFSRTSAASKLRNNKKKQNRRKANLKRGTKNLGRTLLGMPVQKKRGPVSKRRKQARKYLG